MPEEITFDNLETLSATFKSFKLPPIYSQYTSIFSCELKNKNKKKLQRSWDCILKDSCIYTQASMAWIFCCLDGEKHFRMGHRAASMLGGKLHTAAHKAVLTEFIKQAWLNPAPPEGLGTPFWIAKSTYNTLGFTTMNPHHNFDI